jgi:hypothetical protein
MKRQAKLAALPFKGRQNLAAGISLNLLFWLNFF